MAILQKIFIFWLLFNLLDCACESPGYFVDEFEDDTNTFIDASASKKSCPQRSFSESEKEDGAYKCCYERMKCSKNGNLDYQGCDAITKEQYDQL